MAEIEELSVIPTKCSAINKKTVSNFEVVVHHKKTKKADKRTLEDEDTIDPKTEKNEIDMKKARYDVFKFGMSGLRPDKKEEAKVSLAVQLGAKPRRNKRYNYKEYKELKDQQRQEQLEQKRLLLMEKAKSGKHKMKGKKKPLQGKTKKKSGILDMYGRPGLPGKTHMSTKTRKR
ncbi:hypothetical protein C0J52_05727 [Blattella germanica]|nr:hypothetical protein C0J52_05727 [Blattella germanica]